MSALNPISTIPNLVVTAIIEIQLRNQSKTLLQTIRSNVERGVVNFIVNWTPCIEVTTADDEQPKIDLIDETEAVELNDVAQDVRRDQ